MIRATFLKRVTQSNASVILFALITTCQFPSTAKSAIPESLTLQHPDIDRVQLAKAYTLVPGDVIQFDIQNVPEYSGRYQVFTDGSLNLPLVGSVSVQGKTLNQATDQIYTQYRQFIKRPLTRVTLVAQSALHSRDSETVKVLGGVKRPGSYTFSLPVQDETEIEHPTALQAIGMAGGITQSADIRHVQIRRRTRADSEQIIAVNIQQILKEGELTQNVTLQPGDTVFIPTVLATNAEPSISEATFSPNLIKIRVFGEVKQPGLVRLPHNTRLNQALLSTGGIANRSPKNMIEIIRLNSNGTVSRKTMFVTFLKDTNELNNPTLSDNDIIIVRYSSGRPIFVDSSKKILYLGDIINSLFNSRSQ